MENQNEYEVYLNTIEQLSIVLKQAKLDEEKYLKDIAELKKQINEAKNN